MVAFMRFNRTFTLLTLVGLAALFVWASPAEAGRRGEQGFSLRSLSGSYASSGRAGGYLSRSVGVTLFDGQGGVRRVVTINTSDGNGGRKLLHLISTGSYSITPEGLGTIQVSNEFDTGTTSEVTYDFVISKSSQAGERSMPLAEEITGIQREPGQTASLVEEYWTRRPGI